jgi:PKHD-type hydroxylase
MVFSSALGSGSGWAPAPLWASYPDAFSDDECALLIGLMAQKGDKAAGLVDGQSHSAIRQTAIHWLTETPETEWVYNRLLGLITQANRDIFGFALDGFDEDAQVACYQDGGFYDWHIDRGGKGLGRRRKLTVSVQLSTPQAYQGGALELNPNGRVIDAPRTRGTAVVFPAYMLHRVAPVTEGRRHSLVIWTHGPDFK